MAAKTEKNESAKPEQPKRVMVHLPRLPSGQDQDVYVAVNGRAIIIRRGEDVEIEEPFAEVLRNSDKAEEITERFIEENSYNG